jgi:hypothetical protein
MMDLREHFSVTVSLFPGSPEKKMLENSDSFKSAFFFSLRYVPHANGQNRI